MYQPTHDLLKSVKLGLIDKVKSLLWRGVDVNTQDDNGDTALILAIEGLESQVGAVHQSTGYEMHGSCYDGDIEMVQLLIKGGANIEARSKSGNTPLICAAHHGKTEIVKILLERNADIEAKGKYGNTALLSAAYNKHIDTVNSLIGAGANTDVKNRFNQTVDDLLDGQFGSQCIADSYHKEDALITQDSKTDNGWGWGSILLAGAAVIGGSVAIAATMNQNQETNITGDADSDAEADN